jgi:2,4-dienoyl-CoA reductase [(3E)-enoyl-CoA-producing], peroxisomal
VYPQFDSLKQAADRCVKELGSIDYVMSVHSPTGQMLVNTKLTGLPIYSAGAAGNFVAPLSGLTPNGFRAVLEIDTVGTFNTIKATIDHLVQSARRNPSPNEAMTTGGRILAVTATFHLTGMPLQAHVAAAKAAVDSLMASVALASRPTRSRREGSATRRV